MSYISSFQRREIKYRVPKKRWESLKDKISYYIEPDRLYPTSNIYSIYFDTEEMNILKQSLEKPWFREKLRLRWYKPGADAPVFLEWKTKAKGITGKRRAQIHQDSIGMEDVDYLGDKNYLLINQLNAVIERYPGIRPEIAINYQRLSYQGTKDPSIRLTIDEKVIIAGLKNVPVNKEAIENSLHSSSENLIDEDEVLIEIKVANALPLWWVKATGELDIYPESFSKFKTACLAERKAI